MHWNTQHHKFLLLRHSEWLLSFWPCMHHKSRVADKTLCIERHNMDNIPQQYLGKYATHSALCCVERFMVFGPKRPLWLRCLKFDPFITTEQRSQCAEQWVCSLTKTRDQSSQYITTGHWLTRGGGFRMLCMREVERVAKCSRPLSAPSEQMGKFGMKGRWVTQKPMQNLSAGTPGLIGAPPKSGKMLSSSGTSSALNYSGHCRA